ncbi:unnamed protein product [Didymodactylos carnosus]|uniref:Uncharacterized protein n=1 Tax=Didymodactylos carnosus TaxID=1234261 RepID=A0A815HV56_9BILA|nr:unnamed protein product [Didymodactylos carnosus]CAF1360030.1 unnamed protein product [Didymodactylos carnosus]CAF4102322.1 unnamed protein product [Didymodactylos carnosus]CAF4237321.1 unnamed protein product [Didymodactylos carnosus]
MEQHIQYFTNVLLSGSSKEGESASNHFRRDQKLQDINLMYEIGHISSNEQILSAGICASGSVYIRASSNDKSDFLPCETIDDGDQQQQFVNGFNIKQQFAEGIKTKMNSVDLVHKRKYKVSPESASIEILTEFDIRENPKLCQDLLEYVEILKQQQSVDPSKMGKFAQFCECEKEYLLTKVAPVMNIYNFTMVNENSFHDDIHSALSPAFD